MNCLLLAFYIVDKARFQVTGRNAIEVNIEKERKDSLLCVRIVVSQTTSKNSAQVRAARAARLLFLIQPITSLVVAIVVVVSQTP